MSDSQTGKLRAPGTCPSAYTVVRRASRNSLFSRKSCSASSVPISTEARSGCGANALPGAAAFGAAVGVVEEACDTAGAGTEAVSPAAGEASRAREYVPIHAIFRSFEAARFETAAHTIASRTRIRTRDHPTRWLISDRKISRGRRLPRVALGELDAVGGRVEPFQEFPDQLR